MPLDWRTYSIASDLGASTIQSDPPLRDIDYELVVAPNLTTLVALVKDKLAAEVWTVQGNVFFAAGQYIQTLARTTA